MEASNTPVADALVDWITWDQTGLHKLLDDRPRFITNYYSSYMYEMFRNERLEAQQAYRKIINEEMEHDPFYEFFVSIEIVENGKTYRIENDYFHGWSYKAEVTPEKLRVEKPKRPLPTPSLMGIYDILMPFLNQIPYSDEAVVYADIISREDYTSRGIVQRREYNGEYLYTAHA